MLQGNGGGPSRPVTVAVVALGAWLVAMLWVTRYHLLDDALIHLRYAENLAATGHIFYNAGQPSYGTSSLLFVAILAGVSRVLSSPLVPKLVSVTAYLATIAWLVRSRARANHGAYGMWLLLALCGPIGIRWLGDGMETSLMLFGILLLVGLVQHALASGGEVPHVSLACLSLGMVLLRVELLAVVLCMAVVLGLELRRSHPEARAYLRAGGVMVLAAGVALAVVVSAMGHLLPDTAIAKAGEPFQLASLRPLVGVIAGGGSLGLGLLGLWLLSVALLVAQIRTKNRLLLLQTLCVNLLFPALVVLIFARGQRVQGVRHIGWAVFAPAVWNLQWLAECGLPLSPTWTKRLTLAVPAIALAVWAIEVVPAMRAMQGRAASLNSLWSADWQGYDDATLVAWDIGFIGYFTGARACDVNGLVNGREFAALSHEQRRAACTEKAPDLVFGNDHQLRSIAGYLPAEAYQLCGTIDFPNLRATDDHGLWVRRASRLACPGSLRAAHRAAPVLWPASGER